MTFDQALTPKRLDLEEKYPEGNNPLYPGKRIYTDVKTGFSWELTSGRMTVWAAHLVRSWILFYCSYLFFTGSRASHT